MDGTLTVEERLEAELTVEERLEGTLRVNDMSRGNPSLYISEDNKFKITGLRDIQEDEYVTNATGTWTLQTRTGTAIAGGSGSMDYVAGTDGDYVGYMDAAVAALLTEVGRYRLIISLSSEGRELYRLVSLPAAYHGLV